MGYKKPYPDSTSYTAYICGVETIATSAVDTRGCAIKGNASEPPDNQNLASVASQCINFCRTKVMQVT